MKRIDADISANEYKNIYLLYGEEDYLKKQCKDKLIKALVAENDEMNFSRYSDAGISTAAVIDQAETMPFFADYRVILIENSGFAKKTPEDLGEYLSQIPEATIFIFVESAVDKRSKLYKAAKACGRDIEAVMPDERGLAQWVGGILKAEGKQMKREAFSEFLIRTNESMDNMERELYKLISYTGDRKQIVLEDVQAICIARVETRIFDMINAISAKDLKKTLDLYEDMLSAKEPPMRILSMITRQFRQMKVIKECARHGENPATIAGKVGAPDFAVKRSMRLADNFTDSEILNLLEDAADLEKRFKTGRLDDRMAVELLMLKYIK